MSTTLDTDICIIGGGVAGLWLNARLRKAGYHTVLIERGALGGGQSVKSQGIIHGGIKYALGGKLNAATEAIADMPNRWRQCLTGEGELDLSGVRVLSQHHYLWSPGSLISNLAGFFASKALRGRVDQIKGKALPTVFNNPGFKGSPEIGGIYAIEPFNTTGGSGMVENVPPTDSSNILRVTGDVRIRKALAKGKLKPLGATMARYIEERYSTLPFAERWAYPLLEKPFPEEDGESLRRKWDALVKKLTSIRFIEVYAALRDADGGNVGQFEHTVLVTEGGPELLTVH